MELESAVLFRPSWSPSGWEVAEGEGVGMAFRSPVTAGWVGSWVEINRAGWVPGSRVLGTPVICENRVAGGFAAPGCGDG